MRRRRLHIAAIVPGFPAGSQDWFLPQLTRQLLDLRRWVDVSVFALSYPPRLRKNSHEIYVRSFGALRCGSWLPLSLCELRRRHNRRPFDLIHAYWATEPGLVGALAKRLLEIPLLVSALGSEFVALPGIDYGAQMKWRWRKLVPFAIRHADCLICGSDVQLEYVNRMNGQGPARKLVLPVGVEVAARQSPVQEQAEDKKSRFKNGALNLLTVSTLTPVKNISLILDAMTQLPPQAATLQIVGNGPLRRRLARQARALGLAGRVIFHGWVPHEDMAGMYRSADVLVHAAWHEGEGLVIEEALAAGLPVVSTNVGIAREVVTPHENGMLIDPGQSDALAQAIKTFIARPELVGLYGRRSRTIARKRLDGVVQAQKLAALYQELVRRDS